MRIKAEYARRVKRLFNKLRRQADKQLDLPQADPIEQMLLGVLQRGTTMGVGQATLAHVLDHVVDHNDLRVTPLRVLIEYLNESVPQAAEKAERIRQALHGIFHKTNHLNITGLREKSKKDARDFLQSIPGLDAYTVASVLLVGLGHSAFPISDHVLSVLQHERVLPDGVDTATVQTWLERHIPAGHAGAFWLLMEAYARQRAPNWRAGQPVDQKPHAKAAAKRKAATARRSVASAGKKPTTKKSAGKRPVRRKSSKAGTAAKR
jgi:endonuclease III